VPGFNVPPEKLDPLALRAGDLGLPTPAGVSLSSQVPMIDKPERPAALVGRRGR